MLSLLIVCAIMVQDAFSGETIQIPAKKDPKLRPGKDLEGGSGIGIHTERLGKDTPKYVPFLAYGPPNSDSEAQSLAPLSFCRHTHVVCSRPRDALNCEERVCEKLGG